MSRRLDLVVLALVLTLPAPSRAQQAVFTGSRVLLMGDSEAFLLGHEFPALAGPYGADFRSEAVPGSSVIQWATSLHGEWARIRSWRPDTVLVSLGANDACMGTRIVGNEGPYLDTFLRRLARTRARIVWLGPPRIGFPRNDPTQCTATRAIPGLEAFAGMIRGRGVRYIDARDIEVDMMSDELHCTRPTHPGDTHDGCGTWARWVWGQLIHTRSSRGDP